MLDAISGAASEITAVGSAVEGAAAAGLEAAAAAGNGQQLQVDLQALYDYFYKVTDVRKQFRDSFKGILDKQNPYDTACIMTSEISGVAQAIQDTTTAALSATEGLKNAFMVVDAALSHHLSAIADTYTAYVNVDHEKSAELQAAGDTGAGDISYGGGSIAATRAKLEKAAEELKLASAVTGIFG